MTYIIRQAEIVDLEKLSSFLSKAGLETEGMQQSLDFFLLMEDEYSMELKGVVGIEPLEKIGLLRSMVLSQAKAEEILFLLQQVIKLAKAKEMDQLYCMVNNKNAIQMFHLLGFEEVKEEKIPRSLLESNAVKKLVPVNNPEFMCVSIKNVDK